VIPDTQTHAQLVEGVTQLAQEVQSDQRLSAQIRHKYKIKNTVSKMYMLLYEHCMIVEPSLSRKLSMVQVELNIIENSST